MTTNLDFNINLKIGDLIAAAYQPTGRVYIRKVFAPDDKKTHISFLEHKRFLNEK